MEGDYTDHEQNCKIAIWHQAANCYSMGNALYEEPKTFSYSYQCPAWVRDFGRWYHWRQAFNGPGARSPGGSRSRIAAPGGAGQTRGRSLGIGGRPAFS